MPDKSETNQSSAITAHLTAHEKKIRDKTKARKSRAMRNKKRGLVAAIERMSK